MENKTKTTIHSLTQLSLATSPAVHTIPLRLSLAIVMWPHGAQKLLGWFGGHGLAGTMGFFTESMGIPAPLAFAVILIEFFGPVLLVLGLGTRWGAAALAAVMFGAMVMVQWPHGFFMNWSGTQAGEGIQFTLLFIGAALALVASGGGSWSLDRRLVARFETPSGGEPR